MPMNRKLYPADWDAIARQIKDAAGWTCQECGKPCIRPGESRDDFWERIQGSTWEKDLVESVDDEEFGVIEVPVRFGRFILTVAHLNHRPEDCRPENLRAWCSCCHGRFDLAQIELKRQLHLERLGQLNLLDQIKAPADGRPHSA